MSNPSQQSDHIVPPKVYAAVFLTLLLFTFITYKVAFVDLGEWNVVVALLIAFFKSTLVALFFMHVYYSRRRTSVVVLSALVWLFFLIFITMSDYLTRHWLY